MSKLNFKTNDTAVAVAKIVKSFTICSANTNVENTDSNRVATLFDEKNAVATRSEVWLDKTRICVYIGNKCEYNGKNVNSIFTENDNVKIDKQWKYSKLETRYFITDIKELQTAFSKLQTAKKTATKKTATKKATATKKTVTKTA